MSTTEKTHWKRLTNPDYIGAYWLPEGQDVTVTIDYVVREQITGSGGKKEECTVAHLQGSKPFILNNTNCKTISKIYGPYIESWAGRQITLFATTTKLSGDTVECLRIRPKVTPKTIPDITDERLTKAIAAIKAGTYQTDALRSNFALTKEQKQALTDALSEANA
jgi:hypothetical protein